jgi:hypothetical protein
LDVGGVALELSAEGAEGINVGRSDDFGGFVVERIVDRIDGVDGNGGHGGSFVVASTVGAVCRSDDDGRSREARTGGVNAKKDLDTSANDTKEVV